MMSNETQIVLTTKQRNKVNRALKALEEVRAEVDLEAENRVAWYLEDCGNLNLMDGDSHNEHGDGNHGMVIYTFDLPYSGGGGW